MSTKHSPGAYTHLDFESVTEQLVLKTLNGINISKPSGIVGINSKVLKEALVYLSTEFTHLVNLSLSRPTSIFPTDWASGTIKPIPKEGDCTFNFGIKLGTNTYFTSTWKDHGKVCSRSTS